MASKSTIGALNVVLGLDTAAFVGGIKKARSELKSVGRDFRFVGADIAGLGKAITVGVTAPLAALGAASIKAAADFEASMIKVKISTKATARELAQMEKLARELGKTTVFSATEAADAMDSLAKAGVSTADILGGAAKAVVDLAAAAGTNLEPAASAITDVMSQFGKTTAELPAVVNQITGAVNESKLSFNDYTLALGQAGGVAAGLGVSFEEFNAAIAATSPLFSSGSDAGTSFKTFLTSLTPKSNEAAEAMEQFGLSFYDAQGQMKSMAEIAQLLRDKLGGLNDTAKTQALTKIFGTDAMRTALGLMDASAEGLERIAKAIKETNAAAQAAERMKGFNGQLEQLKGSFQEVAIVIGKSGLLESVTKLVTAFADLLDRVAKVNPEALKFGLAFGGVVAALGPLAIGLGATIGAMGNLVTAFGRGTVVARGFGLAIRFALGPLGLLATVAGIVVLAAQGMQDKLTGVAKAAATTARITDALTKSTDAYRTAAMDAATATGAARDNALKLAAARREEAVQTQNAARQEIKLAQARIAALRTDTAQAIASDRYSFRGDAAGSIRPQINAGRIAAQQKLVTQATESLNAALADMASADRILNVEVPKVATNLQTQTTATNDNAKASEAAAKKADEFADKLKELRDRLDPSGKALRDLKDDQLLLREALDRGLISGDEFREFIGRLEAPVVDASQAVEKLGEGLEESGPKLREIAEDLANAKTPAQELAEAFEDVAASLDGMVHAIKSGDFTGLSRDIAGLFTGLKGAFSVGGLPGGIAAIGQVAGAAIGGRTGRAIGSGAGLAGAGITAGGWLGTMSGASALSGIGLGSLAPMLASALPVVGIVAGLAVALKGLLNKPSNKGAGFDLITGQVSGDKRTEETEAAARQAGEAILDAQNQLKMLGLDLKETIRGVVVGGRDPSQIYTSSGKTLTSATGDPVAAVEVALKAVLQGAEYVNDAQRKLVEDMVAAGRGFDDIATALQGFQAAQGFEQSLEDAILQLLDPKEYGLQQVKRSIKDQAAAYKEAAAAGYITSETLDKLNTRLGVLEGLQLDQVLGQFADGAQDATDNLRKLVDDQVSAAQDALRDAFEATAADLEDVANRFGSIAKSLGLFRRSLDTGPAAALSPEEQYKATKAAFEDVSRRAQLGDEEALGELQDVSQAYLDASKAYYGSSERYFADLAQVKDIVGRAESVAERQAAIAQQQLIELKNSVSQLINIERATLSVRDAIAALGAALATQRAVSPPIIDGLLGLTGKSFDEYQPPADEPASLLNDSGLLALNARQPPRFATGGSFRVGGPGGIDKALMSLRMTRGEFAEISKIDPAVRDAEVRDTIASFGRAQMRQWQDIANAQAERDDALNRRLAALERATRATAARKK